MEKLKDYIEDLFKNAPKTKKNNELKEELSLDLEEKYNDLISSGKSEKEAYKEVVSSVGEIDELLETLSENVQGDGNIKYILERKKKTALMVTMSVAFYMLSVISVVILEELSMETYITISSFLTLSGIATCILIYHFISMPKYSKQNNTIVENYKEWKVSKVKTDDIKKITTAILFLLAVVTHLLLSFIFGIWHISWIVYIIALLIKLIIDLIIKLGEK